MGEITSLDYILLPFYLFLIYRIAYYFRNKYYPQGHPYRSYLIPGLTAKIAGAIFIGLIYNYYYAGGDSLNFFYHSKIINSTFTKSFGSWIRLITHHANTDNLIDGQAVADMYWYDDIPSYTTACLGAFIGIFCFTKYLIINVIISSITFIGIWLMFLTFATQYDKLIKPIAIAILLMPGPIVWGSGLFKDSFCMFSVGCLVYCFHTLFEKRTIKLVLILLVSVSIILLILIKAYILVVLLPVLLLKTILIYQKKAALQPEKKMVFYIILAVFAFAAFIIFRKIAIYLSSFTMDNLLLEVVKQKDYLLRVSIDQDGAAYNLGDFDPTLAGIINKILPAINVTLFRPYPWEAKSIIQFFNSIESTGVLLLTLYLILKRNIFNTITNIYKDPNLIMCLFFTLIFAFFVGISSYNFGSLSRYKIPCTPFYMLFLMVLIFNKDEKKLPENFSEPDPLL
ncbi:MAG: hypothetical protein JWQ34_3348 [Mucilaginibacter sp.]|uniref:hypothetical protein n=1 Tax=Mucilaginibacter sp. TaxID=1882438 RepID=UPI00261C7854|nr:hypothetical protein [Mucilaginibacter sp.]MDB5005123.1 hypothetical protein [Mucilaginibacter sp.]